MTSLNEEDRKIVLHALDALAYEKRKQELEKRADRIDDVIEKMENGG